MKIRHNIKREATRGLVWILLGSLILMLLGCNKTEQTRSVLDSNTGVSEEGAFPFSRF
ncbi:MAG: hypothetical protein HUK40_23100 [Desulfobacter sp.]|nr:hypothetical protein [Desulfobacter sp.]